MKYLIVITFLLFASCKEKTKDIRAITLSKVRDIAEMSLVEYDLSKVVAFEKDKWLGNSTFFAKTQATVSFGIDLDGFTQNSVSISGASIEVLLPPVIMNNFSYPAEKIEVIDKYIEGSFFSNVTNQEKEAAYRLAEKDMRDQFQYLGYESQVQNNFKKFLTPILEDLGFTEIYFVKQPTINNHQPTE